MKTGNFEMVTMLLSAMILMNIFQVKANMLDMADNAFDDEYQKCTERMEFKFVPQLLKEEKASHQLFEDVWENAKTKWEAQKTQLSLPMTFKDNHGIALMAYISEAQEQTSFYHLFNKAVKMAGQSRKDYIYGFQFKAFHFYLTKALQLLRRHCEDSYKDVVYSTIQGTSFTFGGLNQARFGHFTLAHSDKPQAASDEHILLTIHTCFGVAIGKFFDKENESGRIIIIPLNEIFHVSKDGTSNNLILRSTNKTCSHYECAFLGGLKMANCVEKTEYSLPINVASPGMKSRESTVSPGMKSHEPIQMPEYKSQEDINKPTPAPAPAPAPVPVPAPAPRPKTHHSASSGKMLLPPFGAIIILISASSIYLFVSL
ncbi:ecto-ADP-ribosyltransferase 3 isoform X3 [Pipistrellus kuhlii]|uniref:ecto-ADP-ribosyltransferase 3 isoform X3 n=1 Tax=Pipistrellus kuhlii TaxID=59472 RepID=UPI00174F394E|nr:ecto-ADP-ribosyltransferase 3 isoform X3 [Pipistrellus kuhlii]